MIFVCLTTLVPVILLMLFAEPLSFWMQRIARRLWALAARMDEYIQEHGEHTMSWPQKIRFTRDEWRKTETYW